MLNQDHASTQVAQRKDDHVRIAVEQFRERDEKSGHNQFDDVRFVHHALAGVDRSLVDTSTTVVGARWPVPIYINAMTGGSSRTADINRQLAIAARETGIPMASGSMSAYLKDPSTAESYRVLRTENPNGYVLANLNPHATPDAAQRAIDLIDANALQIHINSIQETAMAEGDRDFSSWPARIETLAQALDRPVIVKEVGFGLSRETITQLAQIGVRAADVSGHGGTNFALIEDSRRTHSAYAFLGDWGQSAPACLLDAATRPSIPEIQLLASGGVRTPLDAVRALALGATAVGISGYFLAVVAELGTTGLINAINDFLEQLKGLMVVLGARTTSDLLHTDLLIGGTLHEFCTLRSIDVAPYARRRQELSHLEHSV